jgi:hypothetical protein
VQAHAALDLSNKVVFVYKANSDNDIALENPRTVMLNDRYFLVGSVPDGGSSNNWLAGLTTYVAWDQIEEFVVFDSLEDYFERLSMAWTDRQLH